MPNEKPEIKDYSAKRAKASAGSSFVALSPLVEEDVGPADQDQMVDLFKDDKVEVIPPSAVVLPRENPMFRGVLLVMRNRVLCLDCWGWEPLAPVLL